MLIWYNFKSGNQYAKIKHMRHLTFIFTISLIFAPGIVLGFAIPAVTNHQAPEVYFYPQEFDKLVLDLTIPSGNCCGADVLRAITLQNDGSAIDIREIDKIKLWKDEEKEGFQGMGIDKELGTFIFYSQNNSWYLNNVNQSIPAGGLRIFASVEIGRWTADNRTLQMKIPQLSDQNQSGTFDLGDLGIFLESKNNGPITGSIVNSYIQTIKAALYDEFSPKSVITDPKDNSEITTKSYKILGQARDQGSSAPQWVKISIGPSAGSGQADWFNVTATGSNFVTWEYNWQNIAEGTYILKTQSADWLGNVEKIGEGVTVNVISPAPLVPAEEPPAPAEPPAGEEEIIPEKPITQMTVEELKAKVLEIQQQIIELLTQLIQIYQTKLAQ